MIVSESKQLWKFLPIPFSERNDNDKHEHPLQGDTPQYDSIRRWKEVKGEKNDIRGKLFPLPRPTSPYCGETFGTSAVHRSVPFDMKEGLI